MHSRVRWHPRANVRVCARASYRMIVCVHTRARAHTRVRRMGLDRGCACAMGAHRASTVAHAGGIVCLRTGLAAVVAVVRFTATPCWPIAPARVCACGQGS